MATTDYPSRATRKSSLQVLPSANPFFPVKNCENSSKQANRLNDGNARARSAASDSPSSPYENLRDKCLNDPSFQEDEKAGRRIGFYRFVKNIGVGNFSKVKLGFHLLAQENVAIKILDRNELDEASTRRFQREINSIELLHHPNIIRLYEVIETPKQYFIITEFVPEGTLQKRITAIGKMSESDGKYFFAQITAAIEHMHNKGIVHRDIKAENIFFASDRLIKLGDFGFSKRTERDQLLSTFCGSPPYAAPDLYYNEEYNGFCVDLWAMGVLLYFMLTALMPFREENMGRLKKAVINGHYSIPGFLSKQCQEVIRGLLEKEPSERWSIEQLRSSSWLNQEAFPEELEPLPLNLTNFWTSVDDESQYTPLNLVKSSPLNPPKSKLEVHARSRLEELGITPDLLDRAKPNIDDKLLKNKNSINGTYRIVIHRLQKEESLLESVSDGEASKMKKNRSASINVQSSERTKSLRENRRSSHDLTRNNLNQKNNSNSVQMTQTCAIL